MNQGRSAKTFVKPARQGGVATQQSCGAHSTTLANKSTVTQSKVSVSSKPAGGGAGGGIKHPSGASIGKDGVPQVFRGVYMYWYLATGLAPRLLHLAHIALN